MPKKIIDIDTKENAPIGTPDEQTIFWAKSMFERAKKARSDVIGRMDKNLQFYCAQGGQWQRKMPTYRAQIEDNRAFANVESALPILCDNRPKADIVPMHPDDTVTVSQLKDVFDAKWEDLDLDLMVVQAEKDALVLTEGWWKIWFDPSLLGGIGDLAVSNPDPHYMYPDPDARDPLLRDAYFIIYSAPVPLSRLLLQYPDKSEELRKEYAGRTKKVGEKTDTPSDVTIVQQSAYDSGDTALASTWSTSKALGTSDKLLFNEMWVDDQTAEEHAPDFIVYLDNGTKVENSEQALQDAQSSGRDFEVINAKNLPKLGMESGVEWRRKYPFGRFITWVGNTLLRDIPSPYEHRGSPYVKFWRYTVPSKGYNFGEIDQIIPLQEELNKRKSQAIDLLNLCINPPLMVYQASGIDVNKLTNRPGMIIPTNVPVDSAAKWLQMPNIPSAMFVQMSTINQDIDTVSGIHDVTQGRNPTGITAGIAIETLQEASQTRLRLGARFIEWSIKQAARLMVSIIYQYYDEPRTVRKKSADGWTYQTVNFANTQLQGGMPAIKIQPGSTLPTSKSVLKQQAIQLFQLQAIDQQSLLEVFEWPNANGVISRMQAHAQMGGMPNASTPQTGGIPQSLPKEGNTIPNERG